MTSEWRAALLADFAPELRPLILAADPDDLLADELTLVELDRRGFAVERYDEPVAFRHRYELRYRYPGPEGGRRPLVVLVGGDAEAVGQLPYDLVQIGHVVDLSLARLFPNLSYSVLRQLPAHDLAALYTAQGQLKPARLGENDTKAFVLRHVYNIAIDMIQSDAELLAVLLKLHLAGRRLPPLLAERLVTQVNSRVGFADWPLLDLLTDSGALLGFLQERWPIFLERLAAEQGAADGQPLIRDHGAAAAYSLSWPGQAVLPFGAPQVYPLVDTLFLEGRLRPVADRWADRIQSAWVAVGLRRDPQREQRQRLGRLLPQLEPRLPAADGLHHEWLAFATTWAEVVYLWAELGEGAAELEEPLQQTRAAVDARFQAWLAARYHYLPSLPPHPPVMVHHIPWSLQRDVPADGQGKAALIVVDGLALSQWLIVRNALQAQLPGVRFEESAAFAWIPTITSVSRQAIFAGERPSAFAATIGRTAAEPALWSAFWQSAGLPATAVGYAKGLRAAADLPRVESLASEARKRVLGLVVAQVDEMMHGIKLGAAGLQQQIQQWLAGGFLAQLIRLLWDNGYQVTLTADHGNVAARGIGAPREQSLADTRGQRVRILPNETLRDAVRSSFPAAVAWPPRGLPDGYWPLLAPGYDAFAPTGLGVVTHGGAALEEVIVPMIRIKERTP